MNASDINFALKNRLGKYITFVGTFPREHIDRYKIPNFREKHLAIIYNTLDSQSKIKLGHWLTILITKSPCKQLIFFDSAGLQPEYYAESFSKFFLRYSNFDRFDICSRFQPLYSRTCALYNIYFIREISLFDLPRGLSRIRSFFARNSRDRNDKKVINYYLKYLNTRSCTYLLHIFKSPFIEKKCPA